EVGRIQDGARRWHSNSRSRLGVREHPAGRVGLALSAARALPRAQRVTKIADVEETGDIAMKTPTRRDVLKASSAAAAAALVTPARVLAAAPPPTAITPQLIEAAKKEGKAIYYTSIDLPIAEPIAKAFQPKFPGIAVRVERSCAERVFQRIA